MRFITDFLICLVFVIVSSLIFSLIFNILNKSILKVFARVQEFMDKLKRRTLARLIIMVISVALCVEIKDFFNFNYIGLGILIGFFNTLTDVIFKTGVRFNEN
ncbi:hypothetical protein [Clostridium omnivorum]|uniref:Holin n=1 Tax=Clostridium omnivorum TaxID=1604902 RepID=A0ABQ5N4M9_9CLOT|nr:hypothetical protein [Clostridium sp. E14]GLC30167.1 hypothetical protein bsdE14_15770 [Clostridium sp. E14]